MIAWRIISMIFPFIWETMVGKVSFSLAFKYKKLQLLLVASYVIFAFISMFVTPKYFNLVIAHLDLRRKFENVEYVYKENDVLEGKLKRSELEMDRITLHVKKLTEALGCKQEDCKDVLEKIPEELKVPKGK